MNNSLFGFKTGDLEEITRVLSGFTDLRKAAIFGSRAKGNFQAGSDVDIAIWAENGNVLGKLSGALNDGTSLPYKFDIIDFNQIGNEELKLHIERVGKEIYNSHLALNLK